MEKDRINDIEVYTLETKHLRLRMAPELGGRIISIVNKPLAREFLWHNEGLPLAVSQPGSEYDPNFWGAIDELIPNDVPENIDGIDYPDHGELWTTAFDVEVNGETITVHGRLPLSGLHYSKTVTLDPSTPSAFLDYRIKNETSQTRHFLWKLHAALLIKPGDRLVSSALKGKVVDTQYSRFSHTDEFTWPNIQEMDASVVPPKSDQMDFFFLYDAPVSEMTMESNNGDHVFCYAYDPRVFPFQWYFASFGGLLDHYTAILEPCTTMPMSINEAAAKNQTAVLQSGEELTTRVRIYAGEKKNYIS